MNLKNQVSVIPATLIIPQKKTNQLDYHFPFAGFKKLILNPIADTYK